MSLRNPMLQSGNSIELYQVWRDRMVRPLLSYIACRRIINVQWVAQLGEPMATLIFILVRTSLMASHYTYFMLLKMKRVTTPKPQQRICRAGVRLASKCIWASCPFRKKRVCLSCISSCIISRHEEATSGRCRCFGCIITQSVTALKSCLRHKDEALSDIPS